MRCITVFTPSYNRRHTLHRVFESLKQQTYKNFEWIIIDDGSIDNTKSLIDEFKAQNPFFEIRYYYQENQGKHIATNNAVKYAKGELFITLDSDDGCKPQAFEQLLNIWYSIPESERKSYKGVACRCCGFDSQDEILGTKFIVNSNGFLDSDDIEIRLKYKVQGELWGMTRTEVLRENPYPQAHGLKFYPENVYWGNIGIQYKTRYCNMPLRIYYYDNDNITKRVNYKETFYIRQWVLQIVLPKKGFWYCPHYYAKQAVGLIRDGLSIGKTLKELYLIPTSLSGKIITIIATPLGILLKKKS